jgi:hypothetical protein
VNPVSIRLIVFLILIRRIFATEIKLKNGDRFLDNFISEDERSNLFKFQRD